MARKAHTRPLISVTRDADGGLTLHDPQSDLVVSIIATHPDIHGPRGLFVEVYAYNGGPVPWQDASRRERDDDGITRPDSRHPTIAFYAGKEG